MFDPMQPGSLAEADAVARHGDGVVVDVTRLFGHESLETGMLEGLLSGAPGPEVVGLLTAIEAAPLTDREAITVAQAWERVGRWVAARQHRANLRVAGPAPASTGTSELLDLGTEDVRVGLALSPGQADRRVTLARELSTRLPLTATALERGEIPVSHANALVDLTTGRDPEVAAKVEERVLVRAPHQSLVAFKRCVRRALIRFDALGEALGHLQAASRREVVRYDNLETGLTTLIATMPVVDGAIVWNTMDTCARRDRARDKSLSREDDQVAAPVVGTLGAYRADTLLRWAQEDLAHEGAPRPQRRPIEIQVVMDLPTLMGMADDPPRSRATDRSPRRSHGCSPRMRTGGGWAPIPSPVTCSTTATPSTNHPKHFATTSPPATGPAPSRTASARPRMPSSTTPTRSRAIGADRTPEGVDRLAKAEPRPRRTFAPSARGTTSSRPTTDGPSSHDPTAPPCGRAPAGAPTWCRPPRCCPRDGGPYVRRWSVRTPGWPRTC